MKEVIKFYRTADAFGWFSNFAPYPLWLDGRQWPTSEHYYQASKLVRIEDQERIRMVESPMVAARLGRDPGRAIRGDWDAVRDEVMRKALRVKFTQHAALRDILLSTGHAEIVEHTKNDTYWGDGGDGTGQNVLGRLLMEIREELRMPTGAPRD
jgi:ribA/ribD-fused uncharacterized protein